MKYVLNEDEVSLALGEYIARKTGISGKVNIKATFTSTDEGFMDAVVEVTPVPEAA